MSGRRWDDLPLAQASLVADGTEVAFRDQASAAIRDDLDRWGLTVADPVDLYAYLVGQRHIVRHLQAGSAAGVAHPLAARSAMSAELARTSVLLPYLPAEARR